MIIDCALLPRRPPPGRRRRCPSRRRPRTAATDGFVWLGLFEPTPEELAEVRESFGLHELAVEDAQTFHLRPKVEPYEGDVQLVILRTARYDDAREEVDFGEISVFVGPTFVITVRQGVASELRGARTRLEHRPELLEGGQLLRALGDPRPGRRRLRASGRRTRARHRAGRADRVLRIRRADRADLLPAPRGDRLLPRRAPAAGSTRDD